MAMTLLEMATEALDDVGSFVVPTYLFTNEDDAARQLVAIAKKVGRELARLPWQELEATATVTTVSGTDNYALEADFHSMIVDTMWNSTTKRRMLGQQTSCEWQAIVNAPIVVATTSFFRLKANRLYIKPTPASAFSFNYEYRSKAYCQSAAGVAQTQWMADNDVPRLPEDIFMAGLLYYFLKANSLPYSDAEAEYDAILSHYQTANKPHGAINMAAGVTAPGSSAVVPGMNIPDRIPV